jgi:hypothetical protein
MKSEMEIVAIIIQAIRNIAGLHEKSRNSSSHSRENLGIDDFATKKFSE